MWEELFSTPEGVTTFISSLFGTGGVLSTLIISIISGIKTRKYSATVAAASSKDAQITALQDDIQELKDCMGMLLSAFTMQQLSSLAITSDTKKKIVEIASGVEKYTSIKLDTTVKKALDIMTTGNPEAITEEKRQEVIKVASDTQEALDAVNSTATKLIENLEI